MRTYEQRKEELHSRMKAMRRTKARRRYALLSASAGAACLAVTIGLALFIAGTPISDPSVVSEGVSASIFASGALLRYAVISILAFTLGALFTVFCFRLRDHLKERDDDRHN
ncbi:MAG: DUF4179 domain-containing protein [Firmicutes bacterium]|nr:DUF4179 domain-containing protein [Bacillota bacterium]